MTKPRKPILAAAHSLQFIVSACSVDTVSLVACILLSPMPDRVTAIAYLKSKRIVKLSDILYFCPTPHR